jgi:hypothetical protein
MSNPAAHEQADAAEALAANRLEELKIERKAFAMSLVAQGEDGQDDCPWSEQDECVFPDEWTNTENGALEDATCPHEDNSAPCWMQWWRKRAEAELAKSVLAAGRRD